MRDTQFPQLALHLFRARLLYRRLIQDVMPAGRNMLNEIGVARKGNRMADKAGRQRHVLTLP
ncbi:hypothetical protein Saa2_08498 [Streptomyces acidiscabies]|nr:hypothetical protein Saa2_08498 [Streptomyces acidiscabies]